MANEEMSAFNPQEFLNTETEAQFETRYRPIPEGEYMAQVDSLNAKRLDTGEIILDVLYELLDCDKMKDDLGIHGKALSKQALWLDYENGILAEGANKNIKLGRLRAALGQDKKGKAWSFNHLIGAGPIMVNVIQKPAKPDSKDPEAIYNEVNRTAAM